MKIKIAGEVILNNAPIIPQTFGSTDPSVFTVIADCLIAIKDFFVGVGHFFSNVGQTIANINEVGLVKWLVLGLADISDIAIIIALISLILMMCGWKKGRTITYWSVIGFILLKIAGLVANSL